MATERWPAGTEAKAELIALDHVIEHLVVTTPFTRLELLGVVVCLHDTPRRGPALTRQEIAHLLPGIAALAVEFDCSLYRIAVDTRVAILNMRGGR